MRWKNAAWEGLFARGDSMHYPSKESPYGLSLSAGTIDIWCSRLDPATDIPEKSRPLLSDEELQQANSCVSRERYHEFVITRGRLRKLLGGLLKKNPRALVIGRGSNGKPFLSGDDREKGIQFNVSHSGNLALFAVTLQHAVGVDVEKIRPLTDRNLARRFFSPAEYSALKQFYGPGSLRAFFRTWTRKEALIKAAGTGLFSGLGAFTVSVCPDTPPVLLATGPDNGPVSDWSLADIHIDNDYAACTAVQRGSCRLRLWQLSA